MSALLPDEIDDIERVRADAMKAIAQLPDPIELGRLLETGEPAYADALYRAYLSTEPDEARCYRLRYQDAHLAPAMRMLGLVEMRTLYITSFGTAVRRGLMQ